MPVRSYWTVVAGLVVGLVVSLLLPESPLCAQDVFRRTMRPLSVPGICRGAPCGTGNTGGPKQVIMADRPRQAAMAVLQNPSLAVDFAENAYSAADAAELDNSATSVDLYFETVAFSWHFLQDRRLANHPKYQRAWQLYHSALVKLLATGQRFGRLDPTSGLSVNTSAGQQFIKIAYHGFVWKPADFSRIETVPPDLPRKLKKHYGVEGFGAPFVAIRQQTADERFFLHETPFAATVVLRPSLATLAGRAPRPGMPLTHGPLEFYDPMRISKVSFRGQPVPLASDISAPFEVAQREVRDYPYKGLIEPDSGEVREHLFMIEPYQPGKFPIVFVHGLMSSPGIWANLANEILARPDLRKRFQLWAFRYPTGKPFVESAAILRRELRAARLACDPAEQDPALSQMAMIGHSMGGLVAKLVVTRSDDTLWYSIANRPLSEINATDEQKKRLAEWFYFEPLPFITRTVFIGTPHNGSGFVTQTIGSISSTLIQQSQTQVLRHQMLAANNPGVFSPEVQNRLPSSIDMLDPNSGVLKAIQKLCPGPNVQLHSIVGTGFPMFLFIPADGPVSVGSARHPYVSTERFVHTTHTKLHSDPEAVEEIMCILRRHMSESDEFQRFGPCDEYQQVIPIEETDFITGTVVN